MPDASLFQCPSRFGRTGSRRRACGGGTADAVECWRLAGPARLDSQPRLLPVWQEQLFDISVLVRRGLQYLLARTALRALFAVPVALLVFSIVLHPDRTVGQILLQGAGWLNFVWIAAIAAMLPARHRLQTTLDRRFFREAYQQEQVLVQLIDEVRQRDSLADIVHRDLKPENVMIVGDAVKILDFASRGRDAVNTDGVVRGGCLSVRAGLVRADFQSTLSLNIIVSAPRRR